MTTLRKYKKEDKEGILRLFREVWGEAIVEKTRKRWEWEFEANPLKLREEHKAFILEDGKKIVGLISSLWAPLKVHDKIIRALWVGYFTVHPDYRGRQGLRLARAMVLREPYLHMGFPLGKVHRFWKWLGASESCRIDVYLHIINMQAFLARWVNNKIFSAIAAGLWKGFRKIFLGFRLKGCQEITLCEVQRFDERIDAFWKEVSREYKIIPIKDHAYLNWRFLEYPGRKYSIWIAKREEKIVGYIICRLEQFEGLHRGHIVDFLTGAHDAAVLSCLIRKAVQALATEGADVVLCQVASQNKMIQRVLRLEGFLFKKRGVQGSFINNSPSVSNEELTKYEDWFITAGDTELDII